MAAPQPSPSERRETWTGQSALAFITCTRDPSERWLEKVSDEQYRKWVYEMLLQHEHGSVAHSRRIDTDAISRRVRPDAGDAGPIRALGRTRNRSRTTGKLQSCDQGRNRSGCSRGAGSAGSACGFRKDNPALVTVFEIYIDEAAYRTHLETAHFKKFRETTKEMVKSRKLIDADPIVLGTKPK